MIKTFHTENAPNQPDTNTEPQPKVQLFTHVKPSTVAESQPEAHTPKAPAQVSQPAIHTPKAPAQVSQPAIHTPKAPAQVSQPEAHTPKVPAQVSQPEAHTPKVPAQVSQPEAHTPKAPAQVSQPAIHSPKVPAQVSQPEAHTPKAPAQVSQPAIHTPKAQPQTSQSSVQASPAEKGHSPTVLFSSKVRSIQTDILPIDEQLKSDANVICTRDFPELNLKNNDYLELGNMKAEIKFYEPYYQIEFGNTYSKKFQDIQGFLSDYAKTGKVDSILDFGKELIQIAKSININIFNPNKIGTKLSSLLGNRQNKINRIKCEFDGVSDRIDAKLDNVYANLNETYETLESFNYWSKEMTEMHQKLRLSIIALTLKINEEKALSSDDTSDIPTAFQSGNADVIQRWERKINMLLALNQSVTLTFPQMNLYTSNLVTSFERLEEIKVNIIQVWKHQFLGVIAADESSDAMMYSELSDIQEQLIKNIEELK